MGGGLAFLTKKSFNPANWSNQRQVWEARQKNETEKRRLAEREAQLKREREEEELARVVGGEEEGGRKALGFMYDAGKVPGLDRKSNSQSNDVDGIGSGVDGGMSNGNGQEGVGASLFERQPGDDDAAAAFRAMLARGAAADEPTPEQQAAARAQPDAEEGEHADGNDEGGKRPWENDHRTALEKAVGRGINAGSGVTLAQQMERFPQLKGAPMVLQKPQGGGGESSKEGNSAVNVAGLNFKPLGQVLRNIQCLKCGKWGHSRGDRECELSGWNPFASVPSAPPPMAAAVPASSAMNSATDSKPASAKAPPEEAMVETKSDRKHKKEKRRRKGDRHRKKKRKHKRRRRSYSSDSSSSYSSYDSRDRHCKRRREDRGEDSDDSRDGHDNKRRHKSSRRHKHERRRSRSRSRSRSHSE